MDNALKKIFGDHIMKNENDLEENLDFNLTRFKQNKG